jgi:uncharacterized membrane protein YhiD involved in acid resistance
MTISEVSEQGAKQLIELGCAFVLSAAIGLEREFRHKSAGLRTYTVVGTSTALFLLIPKYGYFRHGRCKPQNHRNSSLVTEAGLRSLSQ